MTDHTKICASADAIVAYLDGIAARQGIPPADMSIVAQTAALTMSVRLRGQVAAADYLRDIADALEAQAFAAMG